MCKTYVNYVLWVIIDFSMWVHHCNRCATLLGDVDNAGDDTCGGKRYMGNLCNFCLFMCKPKSALKNKFNKNKAKFTELLGEIDNLQLL